MLRFAQFWRYRAVLRNFISRDLKVKYRGLIAGYLWSLLEPLALVATYWFVFVKIAHRGGPAYSLDVMVGVLTYGFFSSVVTSGSTSLLSNAALIRRVYLPREIFVFSGAGSQFVTFLLSMLAILPFMFLFNIWPGRNLWVWPLFVLLLGSLATGIALFAAVANVIFRDLGYVLRVLLRIGFYVSPVVYPLEWLSASDRELLLWNPLAVLIDGVRSALLNRTFDVPYPQLFMAIAVSFFALFLGLWLFGRWEQRVVKIL